MFQAKSNPNIYVSLGSNLGDRAGNLLLAVRGLLDVGLEVTHLSAIYETEPISAIPQANFLNMAAELKTTNALSPEQLMARLLRIEYGLGRTRDVPMGPRTIDLDLLLFGNEIRNTEFLTLPHPRLHQRRFVLVPLSQIASTVVHPTLRKTISELVMETDDQSKVVRWNP